MNTLYDSSYINIKNNVISGWAFDRFTGYKKVDMMYRLYGATENKYNDIIKSVLQKGHNKFSADSIQFNGLENMDVPLKLSYHFKIPDYANQLDNAIYVNLNLDRSMNNRYYDPAQRKLDVEFDYKYFEKFVTVFKIPDGYHLVNLPKISGYDCKDFGFRILYQHSGNYIKLIKEIHVNTLLLHRSDLDKWNDMIEQLKKAYSEAVVLKSN